MFLSAARAWPDCDAKDSSAGPYGPAKFHNGTWDSKPLYFLVPGTVAPAYGWPLVVFMHGATGQYGMYESNMLHYASHGFVVVFPFVKSPEADKNPLTLNTNGEYILHGIEFARNATSDPTSPLFGRVNMDNVISAGHSMGATCSIMAAKRLAKSGEKLRAVITQHPGICGPFGPPPWPSTWLEGELRYVAEHFPVIFTTATNDAAFWPAPLTAKHEMGCFEGAKLNGTTAAFVQFSASACAEDGKSAPFKDGGHNCPFKPTPETPWILTALKLYAQQDGLTTSQCSKLLWGDGPGSMGRDTNVEKIIRFHTESVEEA